YSRSQTATVNKETAKKATIKEETVNAEEDYSREQSPMLSEKTATVKKETVKKATVKKETVNAEEDYSHKQSHAGVNGQRETVKTQDMFDIFNTPTGRKNIRPSINRNRLSLKRKRTKESPEIEFTRRDEGAGIEFVPITDNTRRYVGVQFGIMDDEFREMPNYIYGRIAKGLKPPGFVFRIDGDGNCFFRAIAFILTGFEEMHYTIRQSICDYVEVHYRDLEPFCDYRDGTTYMENSEMREDAKWGTEIEILATAHMTGRDVIVYNHTGYLRYGSWNTPTIECFFLDNRAGGHFNVVRGI
ncbi:MAG: hypothetical protein MJE68_05495, partial [Proteobacteria bacterium]|nr:hypothetical protein [Pseudomonadota bacterium]